MDPQHKHHKCHQTRMQRERAVCVHLTPLLRSARPRLFPLILCRVTLGNVNYCDAEARHVRQDARSFPHWALGCSALGVFRAKQHSTGPLVLGSRSDMGQRPRFAVLLQRLGPEKPTSGFELVAKGACSMLTPRPRSFVFIAQPPPVPSFRAAPCFVKGRAEVVQSCHFRPSFGY